MKKVLIGLLAIPLIFLALWIMIPGTSIQSIVEDSASDRKLHLEVKGFKKGLWYNVTIDQLTLRSSDKEIVSLSNIHGRINPLSFALLKVNLTVDGTLGEGNITGDITIAKNKTEMNLDFKRININEMPLFKLVSVQGTGTVAGKYTMIKDVGHLEFVTKDASFEPAVFSGIRVPLNLFHGVKGSVDIRSNIVNIASVSFEGKDIYARLKGTVKDAVTDLIMDVMPGKSYLENPLFLGEMQKYMVSPGYYMIPIKGRITL